MVHGWSLFQLTVCRQFGAKPLPEPMPMCCQLDPQYKPQWNLYQSTAMFSSKMNLKIPSEKFRIFCSSLGVLNTFIYGSCHTLPTCMFYQLVTPYSSIAWWSYGMIMFSVSLGSIHRCPVGALPYKGRVMDSFRIFFVVSLNNLLNKQPRCRWFGSPCRWCDFSSVYYNKYLLHKYTREHMYCD